MTVAERYRGVLVRRNLRPLSVRRLEAAVRAWTAEPGWETATGADIDRWLDARHARFGTRIGPRTRYWWLSTLHVFYQWAIDEGLATSDPTGRCVRPRLPQLRARPIVTEDVDVVLEVSSTGPSRVAVTLMLYAGLRCCEVAGLRWADVDEGAATLRVVGKGDKVRWVPIGPRLSGELPARGAAAAPVLGIGCLPGAVSERVARHLRSCGVDATGHQLRHTYATRLHRAGVDVLVIQQLLGHASVATTQLYVGSSSEQLHAAVALVG